MNEAKNSPRMPPAPANPGQKPIAAAAPRREAQGDHRKGDRHPWRLPHLRRCGQNRSTFYVRRARQRGWRPRRTRGRKKRGLRPHLSPTAPNGISSEASASVYALIIHRTVSARRRARRRGRLRDVQAGHGGVDRDQRVIIATRMRRRRRGSGSTTPDRVARGGQPVPAGMWTGVGGGKWHDAGSQVAEDQRLVLRTVPNRLRHPWECMYMKILLVPFVETKDRGRNSNSIDQETHVTGDVREALYRPHAGELEPSAARRTGR